ncbi:MAG: hypothetical protein ACI4JJ_06110 [Huintestinicola sp.]
MNNSHPKTDNMQLVVMLGLFAVFSSLLTLKFPSDGNSLGSVLSADASRAVIQAVLVLPAVLFSSRLHGKSVTGAASEISRTAGMTAALLYAVFFTSAAARFTELFAEFAAVKYFPEGGAAVCALLLGAVCFYAACGGISAVCRMSTVLLIIFAAEIIYLIVTAVINGPADVVSISDLRISPDVITAGLSDITNCGLTVLCFAPAHMRVGKKSRGLKCGAYCSVAAILVVSALLAFLSEIILGSYSDLSVYPLYDAVIYTSRSVNIKPDGIFFVFWAMSSAAIISLMLACAGEGIGAALTFKTAEGETGKIGKYTVISTAVCTAFAAIAAAVGTGSDNIILRGFLSVCTSTSASVILLFIIPLLLFAFYPKENSVRASGLPRKGKVYHGEN